MESNIIEQGTERTVTGAFKVAPDRGGHNGAVSSQWFSRPADQRFLSIDALKQHVGALAEVSVPQTMDAREIVVEARRDDPERLGLKLPVENIDPVTLPSHHSFGQLCSLVGTPAWYLRKLPAPITAINLQYALTNFRSELVKAYWRNDNLELRAITGPDYGRINDVELVLAVERLVEASGGRWKIPGVLDWATNMYDPFAPVTEQSTTLYSSDRDVFMFLVDDTHPIEIGRLPDGSPDLVFRGMYSWNSEVGARSAGLAAFYLRAICMNRNLWGVEGFQEITIRHTKFGPQRFAREITPALDSFANASTATFLAGVKAAKEAVVAKKDDERSEWLGKQGFSKGMATKIIDTVLKEEGHAPESVWDFVQGITAVARKLENQDARLEIEKVAGKLLDKVTRT